ncbi:hypothetical protein LCGC14_2039220 [marine sediment metagenome]|uniref:Uncharacterized protein n=1 Tax=marine sediment metagenome TaxID=412755 RepID=A0A0F9HPF8_9ZZZZ
MKRVCIFIGLKVGELVGVGVVATLLARTGKRINNKINAAYELPLIDSMFSLILDLPSNPSHHAFA